MGSHITWMLFALFAPYSKFCKDGLMMVNWQKPVVKVKIKYIVAFDWNQKLFSCLLVYHRYVSAVYIAVIWRNHFYRLDGHVDGWNMSRTCDVI